MTKIILTALVITLLGPIALHAEPAPWYHWRSKSTGAMTCSQTPLRPGWARADGPYRDARCEKPLPAK